MKVVQLLSVQGLLWCPIHIVIVFVVEEKICPRYERNVNKNDVEHDAKVDGHVWGASIAVGPPVDAHVAEPELVREELARRDPIDPPSLVARHRAVALAVGSSKCIWFRSRSRLGEPGPTGRQFGDALLHHRQEIVLDYRPELVVDGPVLPCQYFAHNILDKAGEGANARALIHAGPLAYVRLFLTPLGDGRNVHGVGVIGDQIQGLRLAERGGLRRERRGPM
mmetsp:Transcript_4311/g.7537  ORF Transcript_4311/g.7537 Transcript_4311/m.7537 type:complete len:223 (-) Transcript_4311:279-947(-)